MGINSVLNRLGAKIILVGVVLGVVLGVPLGAALMPTAQVSAGEKLQQIVVVPIMQDAAQDNSAVTDVADEDLTQTPIVPAIQWHSPAGSLLPDDLIEPPTAAEPVVLAAVAPQKPILPAPTKSVSSEPTLWQKNAVPVSSEIAQSGRPKIAIIIDDVGLNQSRAWRLFRMPAPLTISFLPYAESLPKMAVAAREQGHELMLHMPMEPMDAATDPGPGALRVGLEPTENLVRLEKALDEFSGYVGINNHMGSRFTSDADAIRLILRRVHTHGLLFIDSATSPKTVAGRIADEIGLPNASRHVFLDDDMSLDAVRKSLALLEQTARRSGMAIAIGHPHPTTMSVLEEWLPAAKQRGFDLVPVSWVVNARADHWQQQQVASVP